MSFKPKHMRYTEDNIDFRETSPNYLASTSSHSSRHLHTEVDRESLQHRDDNELMWFEEKYADSYDWRDEYTAFDSSITAEDEDYECVELDFDTISLFTDSDTDSVESSDFVAGGLRKRRIEGMRILGLTGDSEEKKMKRKKLRREKLALKKELIQELDIKHASELAVNIVSKIASNILPHDIILGRLSNLSSLFTYQHYSDLLPSQIELISLPQSGKDFFLSNIAYLSSSGIKSSYLQLLLTKTNPYQLPFSHAFPHLTMSCGKLSNLSILKIESSHICTSSQKFNFFNDKHRVHVANRCYETEYCQPNYYDIQIKPITNQEDATDPKYLIIRKSHKESTYTTYGVQKLYGNTSLRSLIRSLTSCENHAIKRAFPKLHLCIYNDYEQLVNEKRVLINEAKKLESKQNRHKYGKYMVMGILTRMRNEVFEYENFKFTDQKNAAKDAVQTLVDKLEDEKRNMQERKILPREHNKWWQPNANNFLKITRFETGSLRRIDRIQNRKLLSNEPHPENERFELLVVKDQLLREKSILEDLNAFDEEGLTDKQVLKLGKDKHNVKERVRRVLISHYLDRLAFMGFGCEEDKVSVLHSLWGFFKMIADDPRLIEQIHNYREKLEGPQEFHDILCTSDLADTGTNANEVPDDGVTNFLNSVFGTEVYMTSSAYKTKSLDNKIKYSRFVTPAQAAPVTEKIAASPAKTPVQNGRNSFCPVPREIITRSGKVGCRKRKYKRRV